MASLKAFADSTSFHGIGHLAGATSKAVKILWIVLLLLSIGMLGYNTYNLVSDYMDIRSKWTTSIYEEMGMNLSMPTVTICNFNRLRKSKVKEYNMSEDVISPLFGRFVARYPEYDFISEEMDNGLMKWMKVHQFKTFGDIFNEISHQCNDTIVSVDGINGRFVCETENVKPIISIELGQCYQVKLAQRDMSLPGIVSSAAIILDVQIDEYLEQTKNNFHDVGFALQISNEGRVELGSWITIQPGQHSWVGFQMRKTRTRRMESWFNPPCIVEPKLELFPDKDYSLGLCNVDIYYDYMSSKTNCHTMLTDTKFKYPPCEYGLAIQMKKVLANKTEEEVKKIVEEMDTLRKKCKESCNSVSFDMTITNTRYPAESHEVRIVEKMVGQGRHLKPGDINKNFAALSIFWKTYAVRILERHEKTTIEDLISNLGGQFGLWMGGSVLTLSHAFMFFTGRLMPAKKEVEEVKKDNYMYEPEKKLKQ